MPGSATEYSATVWTHFRSPCNAGEFPAGTAGVLGGEAGARQRGRAVAFQLQVNADGRVADCRYRVYGCPATIALCSLTSEALKGRPLAAATAFSVVALAEQLDLPAAKRSAALTVEDAIRSAAGRYNSPGWLPLAATELTHRA
ncbi:MAG: iron-sulfur cluster assembly scaffold protein [Gammaproteobacteria bacterium]